MPFGGNGFGGRGKRKLAAPESKGADWEMDEEEIKRIGAPLIRSGFGGVVARDEVNAFDGPRKGKPLAFVMNTDTRDKGGRHWVAVDWRGDRLHYYDPFGKNPSPDTLRRLQQLVASDGRTGNVLLKVNRVPNQRANSSTCGAHSLRFLKDMAGGKSFAAATEFDTKEGEERARALVGGAIKRFRKYL